MIVLKSIHDKSQKSTHLMLFKHFVFIEFDVLGHLMYSKQYRKMKKTTFETTFPLFKYCGVCFSIPNVQNVVLIKNDT